MAGKLLIESKIIKILEYNIIGTNASILIYQLLVVIRIAHIFPTEHK